MTLKKFNEANSLNNKINELNKQIKECKHVIELISSKRDNKSLNPIDFFRYQDDCQNILGINTNKEFNKLCLELWFERLQKQRELLISDFRNL